jgi:ferrous iron transport protein B
MYLLGIVVALGMAWLFKKTLLRGETPMLVMELPPYRKPVLRKSFLRHMWDRAKLFLRRAGTVILGINILLWFMVSIPAMPPSNNGFAAQRAALHKSLLRSRRQSGATNQTGVLEQLNADAGQRQRAAQLCRAGRTAGLQPLIAPLGFDWKMGIGIVWLVCRAGSLCQHHVHRL